MNARTEKDRKATYQKLSKYDIRNTLAEPDLPLSDLVHGPYQMMPPELLHASGSGLIMYQFQSLKASMGSNKDGTNDRNKLDHLHHKISADALRQSDKSFSRGSVRNGIIDGTKCQSTQRRGNLFRLLCLS